MYNFIELCSGCGGLSTGFINAGLNPLILNEINKICCDTLRKNHSEDILSKIHCIDFTDNEFKEILNNYVNKVDILVAGIPCQSFSIIGKRGGLDDKRGNLLVEFIKIISILKPKIFVIENVKGLLYHNNGDTLKYVINLPNIKNDYDIIYKVLNSYDYGVPQKRERLFIVGGRKEIKIMDKDFFNISSVLPRPLLRDVLMKNIDILLKEKEGQSYSKNKIEIMKRIPAGGCWINLPENIQKEYLGKMFESGGGKRGIARRLSMDEPCLTLTTSPCQKQTERCHPIETRPLTVREYARIQTFPDSYQFCGSTIQKYKQIGNAVPVKLAEVIAKRLIEILDQSHIRIICNQIF